MTYQSPNPRAVARRPRAAAGPLALTPFLLLAVVLPAGCAEDPDAPAAGEPEMVVPDADEVPDDPLPVERPELREGEDLPPEQLAFWEALEEHCGNAYAGEVDDHTHYYEGSAGYEEILAHFVECEEERLHMSMHMNGDRSRNWILTREGGTIYLRHDHRNEDGSREEFTDYGGPAALPGLEHRQIFLADEHTAELYPERHDNFWFMDLVDDDTFAYGVHWPEHGHSIRIHFDLSETVETPPNPWGY